MSKAFGESCMQEVISRRFEAGFYVIAKHGAGALTVNSLSGEQQKRS